MDFGTFEWADLITVLLLVVLEGLLSGDNALVLAVLVMPLPEEQQRKALRYGIIGAFVLRVIATFLAVWLVQVTWVSLVGGGYLLYLAYKHFAQHVDEQRVGAVAKGMLGLSLFWTIVIKADLIDLVFAVDSILAAVGMSKKLWVIIAGGLIGILMMRLLTLQVLELVKRYPKLIDGAYLVIVWVGIKLVWEYLHIRHWVPFEIPQWVGIAVVIVLFTGGFIYARMHAADVDPLSESADDARALITHRMLAGDPSADNPPGPKGVPDDSSEELVEHPPTEPRVTRL